MLVVDENGTSKHTGSATFPPIAGTVNVVSNNFVSIGAKLIMVEDGTMEIPNHQYSVLPPLFHSHSFSPDTFSQGFVTVEGRKIVLVGDSYSGDATEIDGAGTNTFVSI